MELSSLLIEEAESLLLFYSWLGDQSDLDQSDCNKPIATQTDCNILIATTDRLQQKTDHNKRPIATKDRLQQQTDHNKRLIATTD